MLQGITMTPEFLEYCRNRSLHALVRRGELKPILKALKICSGINRLNVDDMSPLHLAVAHGHHHLIGVLIENCANIEIQGRDGVRPLHMITVSPKKMECLTELLKHNANINGKDHLGNTLLHSMLRLDSNEVPVIKKLIECGANPNIVDIFGNNCLHALAEKCCYMTNEEVLDIVSSIMPKLLYIDLQNIRKESALSIAIEKGNLFLACFLLQNGADFLLKCWWGLTPFDMAVNEDHDDVIQEIFRQVVARNDDRVYSIVAKKVENDDDLRKMLRTAVLVYKWIL